MLDAIMSMLGFLPDCGDSEGRCVTPDDGGTVTVWDGSLVSVVRVGLVGVMVAGRVFWAMV